MPAADLFAKSVSRVDIGRELEVFHQTVSDWHEKWAVVEARHRKVSCQSRSSAAGQISQLGQGGRVLEKGPEGQWGLRLVVVPGSRKPESIPITGHRGEVPPRSRLAKCFARWGWTRQRPARRAAERDDRGDRAVGQRTLAQGKKTPGPEGRGSSSRTRAGSSLLPSVRATWAPEGKDACPHSTTSTGSACRCRPRCASDPTAAKPPWCSACNWVLTTEGVDHGFPARTPPPISTATRDSPSSWDGLLSHRSKAMQAFIKSQRTWLVARTRLPAYASPTSIRSNRSGATSKAANSPTSVRTPSTRLRRSSTRDSAASA